MTTIRPTLEIAARRAMAERVDALLAGTPGDPRADPRAVASLAGWLAAGVRAREVDAVLPATPGDWALAAATAGALNLGPAANPLPSPGARVLIVGMDRADDGVFERAIAAVEAAGARVVGAAAVCAQERGVARLVAPVTGRVVPFRSLTVGTPVVGR